MIQSVTTPIPPPPKDPHLRSMVPGKPLLSRGSSLHSQIHQALFRSTSVCILETEPLTKLQILLKHRLCLAPCFAYVFFPLAGQRDFCSCVVIKKLQCDLENYIVSYKVILLESMYQHHEWY